MEPWLIRTKVQSDAKLRLLCFTFPGGSASEFARWPELLSEDIEVCAVQLPGRQKRISDPLLTDVHKVVGELSAFLKNYLDLPIAIFGDCAGAFLAFELCHHLMDSYNIEPYHLFLTSCKAPHLPYEKETLHDMPDNQFKKAIIQLGVVPEWLQQNDKILTQFLPLIRADFEMVEVYQPSREGNFAFPITAFWGDRDTTCSEEEISCWDQHTTSTFRVQVLEGKHNIAMTHLEIIIKVILEDLKIGLNLPKGIPG